MVSLQPCVRVLALAVVLHQSSEIKRWVNGRHPLYGHVPFWVLRKPGGLAG